MRIYRSSLNRNMKINLCCSHLLLSCFVCKNPLDSYIARTDQTHIPVVDMIYVSVPT